MERKRIQEHSLSIGAKACVDTNLQNFGIALKGRDGGSPWTRGAPMLRRLGRKSSFWTDYDSAETRDAIAFGSGDGSKSSWSSLFCVLIARRSEVGFVARGRKRRSQRNLIEANTKTSKFPQIPECTSNRSTDYAYV